MRPRLVLIAALIGLALPAAAQPARRYAFTEFTMLEYRRLDHKDYVGAIDAAKQALSRNPNDPLALAGRGQAYEGLGQYKLALADHDAVLAITPDDNGALTNACWGRALANADLDRGLELCNRALVDAAAPHNLLKVYDTRAFLQFQRGEYGQSVADYDAALKVMAGVPDCLYGRGLAKLRLGQEKDGRADMAEAVKRQPGIAEVFAKRGAHP